MDLIIQDDFFRSSAEGLRDKSFALEDDLEEYCKILLKILDGGIKKGKTADNLNLFSEQASLIKGKLVEINKMYIKDIIKFLEEVDEKDQKLY